VIVTGGGPGVMEAGNRGAADVDALSISLNITLPHEQAPNRFATPELCFNFHYFAVRKMHFLLRAKAMAIFPGGFGTMDELFEALTLIQTRRMQRIPVLLFGESFWRRVIDLEALAEEGTIAPEDLDLVTYVDTAEDGWAAIRKFYDF
ncbi:MAG: LOG family protein, partial [Aurantimonas coralicida]|nr:LOG family protein [Aurantimonas coralicida]